MFDFEDELLVEKQQRLKKPKMYKVLFHNDHYTTMEFVVLVLRYVFQKSLEEATKIMLEVHVRGIALVGIYTYEVAATGINRVQQLAEELEYPFLCTMEEA